MYVYLSSLVKYKNKSTGWISIDIRNMKVKDIVKEFSDVYFTFEHTILPGNHYCFLKDLLTVSINLENTLVQALNAIDNTFLPSSNQGKNLLSKSATFADALQAGWTFHTIKPGSSPGTESIGSLRTDLYLQKDGISPSEAGSSLVCLINGMAHWTFTAYEGLIALDAGRTMKYTDSNLVNFLNLGMIGDISYINIDETNVKPGTHSMLTETFDVYLDLQTNLVNKSIIVSIGGILYLEGDVINVINRETGHVKLNWHRIDHGSLFYEIATCLNPDDLGTIKDNILAGILTKSSIYDPANLDIILGLPQSFVIVVDSPNVVQDYKAVQNGHLKNVLTSYTLPNMPIKGFSPRLLPYRIKDERGMFAIHVDEYKTPAFMSWTTTQFSESDYISFGIMRSSSDLDSSCVFMDIKTQWFE